MQKKNRKLRIGSFLFFCILQHNGNEKHSESGLNTYVLYSLEQR